GLVLALARNIAGRLADVSGGADAIAAGELTRRVGDTGHDEIGRLGRAFNAMAARLEEMIQAATRPREELQAAVERCSAWVAKVADGDLTARISPDGDSEINRLYQYLNGMVADLGAISLAVRSRATEISQASSGVLAAVSQHASTANQQSAAISEIATTMSEVRMTAEQTASKAAEVAALARNLADQSKEATSAVRTILGEIQRATNAVVLATEAGARSAEERSGQAEHAGEVIAELTGVVHQAAQAVQVIAVSAHEQSVGMDQ